MAKLNVRGRVELLRLEFEDFNGIGIFQRKIRRQRVYMSDGHVLEKTTWYTAEGKVDFSDGWKDKGKLRNPSSHNLGEIKTQRIAVGWREVEKSGSASGKGD